MAGPSVSINLDINELLRQASQVLVDSYKALQQHKGDKKLRLLRVKTYLAFHPVVTSTPLADARAIFLDMPTLQTPANTFKTVIGAWHKTLSQQFFPSSTETSSDPAVQLNQAYDGHLTEPVNIILFLLWILAGSLNPEASKSKKKELRISLVSRAISAGKRNFEKMVEDAQFSTKTFIEQMSDLESLKEVMDSISEALARRSIPLENAYDRASGKHKITETDMTEVQIHKYWGYSTQLYGIILVDINTSPHVLLERHDRSKILVPKRKIDDLLITLFCLYGIGFKAITEDMPQHAPVEAMWIADPPEQVVEEQRTTALNDLKIAYVEYALLERSLCRSVCGVVTSSTSSLEDIQTACPTQSSWCHHSAIRILLLDAFSDQYQRKKRSAPNASDGHNHIQPPGSKAIETAMATVAALREKTNDDVVDHIAKIIRSEVLQRIDVHCLLEMQRLASLDVSMESKRMLPLLIEYHMGLQEAIQKQVTLNPSQADQSVMPFQTLLGVSHNVIKILVNPPITKVGQNTDGALQVRLEKLALNCTCGECATLQRDIITNKAQPSIAIIRQFSKNTGCNAIVKYWEEDSQKAEDFLLAVMRHRVYSVGSSGLDLLDETGKVNESALKGVMPYVYESMLDQEEYAQQLSAAEISRMLVDICANQGRSNNESNNINGLQQIAYVHLTPLMCFGNWLPQLAKSSATMTFAPAFAGNWDYGSEEFFQFTWETEALEAIKKKTRAPSEPYAVSMFSIPRTTVPQPPLQVLEESISIFPPDQESLPILSEVCRVHLICRREACSTLNVKWSCLDITTSFAPSMTYGPACTQHPYSLDTKRATISCKELLLDNFNLPSNSAEMLLVRASEDEWYGLDTRTSFLLAVWAAEKEKRIYLRHRQQCVECAVSKARNALCAILAL